MTRSSLVLSRRCSPGRMVSCASTILAINLCLNNPTAMGNPSTEILGLITCTVFVGGFVGALLAAAPADRYGRRSAMQIGSFLGVVGSCMQAAAPSRGVFIGGRAVLGVGLSFTTTAGPNLLNELAHPRLRGKMASMVKRSLCYALR